MAENNVHQLDQTENDTTLIDAETGFIAHRAKLVFLSDVFSSNSAPEQELTLSADAQAGLGLIVEDLIQDVEGIEQILERGCRKA